VQSIIDLSPSSRIVREVLAHSGVARAEPFKQKFEGSTRRRVPLFPASDLGGMKAGLTECCGQTTQRMESQMAVARRKLSQPDRVVIIEFPDIASLNAWYTSPRVRKHQSELGDHTKKAHWLERKPGGPPFLLDQRYATCTMLRCCAMKPPAARSRTKAWSA
jgi:hypothetical protein